jgi:hypothetical protein
MRTETELRVSTLLSLQRALVGEIGPSIRAIAVAISSARIDICVFHDGHISSELIDDFESGVMSNVIADFPYPDQGDPVVDCAFIRSDAPAPLALVSGIWVYARQGTTFSAV